MACKIVTACVCLHNVAHKGEIPLPPPEDWEDVDGKRPGRVARAEPDRPPADGGPRTQVVAHRNALIEMHFSRPRAD